MNLESHIQIQRRSNIECRVKIKVKEPVNNPDFALEISFQSQGRYLTIPKRIIRTMQRKLENSIGGNLYVRVLLAGIDLQRCSGIKVDNINT